MLIYELRISDLRVDHDLKQKDIAKKLNITRSLYSLWELGKCDIPILKLNELANFYKVSLDYLLGISNINTKTEKDSVDFDIMRKRLKDLRKENKISQVQLGKEVGFSQKTYSNYEIGISIPTTFKLLYITKFYNVSFDYLSGRSNIKNIKKSE